VQARPSGVASGSSFLHIFLIRNTSLRCCTVCFCADTRSFVEDLKDLKMHRPGRRHGSYSSASSDSGSSPRMLGVQPPRQAVVIEQQVRGYLNWMSVDKPKPGPTPLARGHKCSNCKARAEGAYDSSRLMTAARRMLVLKDRAMERAALATPLPAYVDSASLLFA
jgi:hypothetical protein